MVHGHGAAAVLYPHAPCRPGGDLASSRGRGRPASTSISCACGSRFTGTPCCRWSRSRCRLSRYRRAPRTAEPETALRHRHGPRHRARSLPPLHLATTPRRALRRSAATPGHDGEDDTGARPMASLPGTTPGGRSMTRTINPAAGCPNTRGRCAYPGPAHRLNRSAPYCRALGVEQHGHAADRVRRRGQRSCEGSVAIAVPAIGAFFEARECNGQASVRMHRPQHPAVRLIDPRTEEGGPLADVGAEIALVDPLHNCGIVWLDLCPPADPDLADRGRRVEVVDDHSDWSATLHRSWKRSGLGAAEPETLPLKQEPQAAQQRRPPC